MCSIQERDSVIIKLREKNNRWSKIPEGAVDAVSNTPGTGVNEHYI